MGVLDSLANAFTLGLVGETDKSLRDQSFIGGGYDTGAGTINIARLDVGPTSRLFRKQNVRTLRQYAEFSVWVRAALDIYRDSVAQARPTLQPADEKKPVSERIARRILALLAKPNPEGDSFSGLCEELAEDFFVLGHGAMEIGLRRNVEPHSLFRIDAARLGFYDDWDGDPAKPRYALYERGMTRPSRSLPNLAAMVLINRPRSYDRLGLSHVEALDVAVRALLETDESFLREARSPTKAGAFNLGKGVSKPQVDQVRAEMTSAPHPFVVMGGAENPQYISFQATEREIRALDRQVWFVRQVAAIFQIPISKLQVKAEGMNRASTEAQFDQMEEGCFSYLQRLRDAINVSIVGLFGSVEEHNIVLDFPILSRKDEKRQAEVSKTRLGGQPFASINEARRDAGMPPLTLRVAEEPLVTTRAGAPIPLSVLEAMYFRDGEIIPPTDTATPELEGDESSEDEQTEDEQD